MSLKPTDLIVHQANCVSFGAKGLAQVLFSHYPQCNVYKKGIKRIPGTVLITPPLVHLFGENDYHNTAAEKIARPKWFKDALDDLVQYLEPGQVLYFPYKIGCGLAKGDWNLYKSMIEKWSLRNGVVSYIVKRPEDK